LGQGVGLLGAVAAALTAALISPWAGGGLLLVALLLVTFYSAMHLLLEHRVELPALPWVAPTFEVVLPALAWWILARTGGAELAVDSWVVPLLFAIFVAASILRLDPRLPLGMGSAAALLYGFVWWTEQPAAGVPGQELSLQLVRMGSLVGVGLAASLGVRSLRQVLDARRAAPQRELFGKYRLGREIASGGMGRVVEAAYCPEGGFERRVAMKVLHPHLASQPGYVERFRTEAEIAARLAHPNIVSALDFGRVNETWFLVMEYVDGRTLQDILAEHRRRDRPLHPRVVAWLGQELAQGLDYAHRGARDEHGKLLGVVHRDLSPSNVLLDRAGGVRITDFGVARMLRGEALHTGTLMGKPAYVAPETIQNQKTDERSDLWSVGVILWEALANQRLFARDNEGAAMLAVVDSPIPAVSSVREGLAPAWDELFARLLVREPDQRFASAAELHLELGRIALGEGPVLAEDLRELLEAEDALEELELDVEGEEITPEPPAPEPVPAEQTPASADPQAAPADPVATPSPVAED
jgi:serine/threonine protein kinase